MQVASSGVRFDARIRPGTLVGYGSGVRGRLGRGGDGALVAGQKLGDALSRMIGDAGEDVGEPGSRIDFVVQLARLDQLGASLPPAPRRYRSH